MKKQFIFFVGFVQLVLTLAHAPLYFFLLWAFPSLQPHASAILWVLFILSVSFTVFTIADFKIESEVLRFFYILSSVWMPLWFYLLLASLLTTVFYLVFGINPSLAGLVFIAASVLLTAYGLVNARILRVTELRVKLQNLPGFWKGRTAVFVSDIHLGHVLRKGFAEKVINKINSLNPEIVLIPGDFFDGVKTDFAGLAVLFKNLRAPSGTYFASGNHEQFAGYEECERAITGAGIKILENAKVEIHGLQILGTAYASETDGSLFKLLSGLVDPGKPSVYLKHVPSHIPAAEKAGVALQLSGHSHQGQIWPGSLITKKVWKGFDYGHKIFGNLQVLVSSGAGTWGPPMRVFTKSEIVKIIFD